jgi:hypothetical protein
MIREFRPVPSPAAGAGSFRNSRPYAMVAAFPFIRMATCPRCKGHLTDTHRCPRRPLLRVLEIVVVALLGGFFGLLLVAVFDPHGQITDMDTFSALAGALVAVGINRALRA